MPYQKINTIFRKAASKKKEFSLSPKQIETFKKITDVALAVIAMAGIATVSIVAPNLLLALDKLFFKKTTDRRLSSKEKQVKATRAFYYLKSRGLIRLKSTGSDFKVSLTNLGKNKLSKLNFQAITVPKPSHWDGKWWLIAADIPTKNYRRGADSLRKKLKQMGFHSLQRTLWLYPFNPCREIEFITNYYGIALFVTVMEISRLDEDDERKLKIFFKTTGLL